MWAIWALKLLPRAKKVAQSGHTGGKEKESGKN